MTQYLCKHMGRPLWEKQADKNSNQVIDLIDVFFLVLFYANCDLNYFFYFLPSRFNIQAENKTLWTNSVKELPS
jgi:hypothetical protein